jgi:hypothetical protein
MYVLNLLIGDLAGTHKNNLVQSDTPYIDKA